MLNVSSKYSGEESEEMSLKNFLTLLFLSWKNSNRKDGSQPVGRNPYRGCISDIYITIHNSSKIPVMK